MRITASLGRVVCVVTAALALNLPTVSAATASQSAALPCSFRQASGRWYCDNVHGARMFASPDYSTVVGYKYTRPSIFYCRTDNGAWVGGPHQYRWLRTPINGDSGPTAYMKDTDIYSETDPLPTC
jgi:hypothetical protein